MSAHGLPPEIKRIVDSAESLSVQELQAVVINLSEILAAKTAEAARQAGSGNVSRAHSVLTQEIAEKVITQAGGYFLGEIQHRQLGRIGTNFLIPPIPQEFSTAFLNAEHPLRGGKIAEHIVLGFDLISHRWCCFEKSVVPGSQGLVLAKQDRLLLDQSGRPITVHGLKYVSPTEWRPVKDIYYALRQSRDSCSEFDLLRGPHARTGAKTQDENDHYLLVKILKSGFVEVNECGRGFSCPTIGLLAGWEIAAQPEVNQTSNNQSASRVIADTAVVTDQPATTRFKFVNK